MTKHEVSCVKKLRELILDLKACGFKKSTIIKNLGLTESEYNNAATINRYRYIINVYGGVEDEDDPYYLLKLKINAFKSKDKNYPQKDFTYVDIINKFGPNPVCYISGEPLSYNSKELSLDHLIPAFNGGSNELDNLGLCLSSLNWLKSIWTVEEMKKQIAYFAKILKLCE